MFISPLMLGILIWESMGTDSLSAAALSGHSRKCSFLSVFLKKGHSKVVKDDDEIKKCTFSKFSKI